MSSSRLPASAGQDDEQRAEQDDREDDREAHRLLGDLFLFRHLLVRGPGERPIPEPERFAETHHPAHDRDLAVLVGPAGRLADVDLDVTFGHAHGDGVGVLAAHHHAFEHRLPAHVAGFGRTLAPGHDGYCYFFALAARRWKRSTRPPVSTSFCLPV